MICVVAYTSVSGKSNAERMFCSFRRQEGSWQIAEGLLVRRSTVDVQRGLSMGIKIHGDGGQRDVVKEDIGLAGGLRPRPRRK